MNPQLFWRALAVQAVLVGVLFAVLSALLSKGFFEDWGFVVGPLAWVGCSLVTARVLSLPAPFVLFAAVAGGVAGAIVLLAVNHWAGMVVALLVFAASCGSYEPEAEETGGGKAAGGERPGPGVTARQ